MVINEDKSAAMKWNENAYAYTVNFDELPIFLGKIQKAVSLLVYKQTNTLLYQKACFEVNLGNNILCS